MGVLQLFIVGLLVVAVEINAKNSYRKSLSMFGRQKAAVCKLETCDNELWNGISKFFEASGSRRQVAKPEAGQCKAAVDKYGECVSALEANLGYCGCDEEALYSLVYPVKAEDLCGEFGGPSKCSEGQVGECLKLHDSIWMFLMMNGDGSDNGGESNYGSQPGGQNGGFESQFGGQKRVAGESAALGITDANVNEKINDFAKCAETLKADAVDCPALGDSLVTVAFMRATVNKCDVEEVAKGCGNPEDQAEADPCAAGTKDKAAKFYQCFLKAVVDTKNTKCASLAQQHDTFVAQTNTEIDAACAEAQKLKGYKDACAAPKPAETARGIMALKRKVNAMVRGNQQRNSKATKALRSFLAKRHQ